MYLRDAWSPLCGFLYGWTLFLVIQTGTVAAVAVGFARYLGVLWPAHLRKQLPDPADPLVEQFCHFCYPRLSWSACCSLLF